MKTKKIVLTTMPTEGEFINWTTPKYFDPARVNKYMPLGILSLASNLSKKHEIVILDPSSEGWNIEETIEKIEKEKPEILGLSVITRRVYAMNKILKKVSTPYKVVGGPHATYYAKQILQNKADAVFVGPLTDLEFKIAVEESPKGRINCNTKINDIKFPNRDFLNIKDYFPKVSLLFKAENRLPMFSSIGCPNKCTFCNVQSKKLQLKNSETVINEMQYLYSIGCKSIHILDDNFNINSKHIKGILNEMEKRNFHIEWSGRGQIRTDLSLTKRLADSGFKRIHVGFEALDDKILKFFNKPQGVKHIEEFCKAMNKNNIDMLGYFISGSPVETEKYRNELPKKIIDLGIKYPYFNILFPEPNTEYYQSLLRGGHYKKDYWAEYMENPTPYFEIPYPYGETKKQEIIEYTNKLIKEFENERNRSS